jgi:serine/threonine protein phosphatase PrpC
LCVYIIDKIVYVSNIGDSECFIFDSKGATTFCTNKHDLKNKTEKKRIEKVGGTITEDGYIEYMGSLINMTRSIGDHHFKRSNNFLLGTPVNYKYSLQKDDLYIVVGCDGLWDYMKPQDVFKFIDDEYKNGKKTMKIVDNLTTHIIKELEGQDNITLAIYCIK